MTTDLLTGITVEGLYFIAAALYIYGLHNLFIYETDINGNYIRDESMLFGRLSYSIDRLLKERYKYLAKPLYACMPCMASVHGLYIYVILPISHSPEIVIGWLVMLSGAMKLISKI